MKRSGLAVAVMLGWCAVAGRASADEGSPAAAPAKPAAASATEVAAPAVAAHPADAAPARSATAFLATVPSAKPAAKPEAHAAGGIAGTLAVGDAKPADYPDLAKIQLQYAIRAAMTKVQGKVLQVELEPAGGFLVWEVEIVKTDHTIFAVKVDAGNGAVLAVERDEPGNEDE
jgi:hypothetical protein